MAKLTETRNPEIAIVPASLTAGLGQPHKGRFLKGGDRNGEQNPDCTERRKNG
jgi:hypothetical protein